MKIFCVLKKGKFVASFKRQGHDYKIINRWCGILWLSFEGWLITTTYLIFVQKEALSIS